MYTCAWYFLTYLYGLGLNGLHALLCIANNRHAVTITTHAFKRHFLIWMTTMRQPTKRRYSCVLTLKYTFICVYWWTRQRIHNTLIVVNWYLRLMGDKTIPDSAEPRLESFYPPFVAGIDLPHQGVVDSYNLYDGISDTGTLAYSHGISSLNIIIIVPEEALTQCSPQYHACFQMFDTRYWIILKVSEWQYGATSLIFIAFNLSFAQNR